MAKLLLVDDEENLREILLESLTEVGHSVTVAMNGKDAQLILEHQSYDLVISDIQMPVLNGIELLQWVRTHRDTPVILMSGFSRSLEQLTPKELGAYAFISKPFQPEDLIELVDNSLTEKYRRPQNTTKNS